MRNIYNINKVPKELLTCGVRRDKSNNKFIMDFDKDYPNDILDLVGPELVQIRQGARIYWFGYEFKGGIDSRTRGDFIRYLKRFGNEEGMSDEDLDNFIIGPIAALDTKINSHDMNCIISPTSGRSTLVGKIREAILRESSRSAGLLTYDDVFELKKLKERDIKIDWNRFEYIYEKDRNKKRFEDILAQKEYEWNGSNKTFSLSRSFPDNIRELRRLVKNYLVFPDEKTEKKFLSIEEPNILIVDDILTTGSTVDEIINILADYGAKNSIYIYTLLNNDHK